MPAAPLASVVPEMVELKQSQMQVPVKKKSKQSDVDCSDVFYSLSDLHLTSLEFVLLSDGRKRSATYCDVVLHTLQHVADCSSSARSGTFPIPEHFRWRP